MKCKACGNDAKIGVCSDCGNLIVEAVVGGPVAAAVKAGVAVAKKVVAKKGKK
jgi:hypothetical protein